MRRYWPAIGVCALAAACGRPNPGFKLIDSSDAGDSEGQSASAEPTDSGTVTSTPTSTEVSGTMSGSEGSMSATGSDSTGDTVTTMMGDGEWVFPKEGCDRGPKSMSVEKAVADTFFMYELPMTKCTYLTQMGVASPNCQDLQFSEAEAFQIYLNKGNTVATSDDVLSMYAVRFNMPMFMGDTVIPLDAYVSINAKIRVAPWPGKPMPWENVMLEVRRFTDGDNWNEDLGLEFTPCRFPAASFRCLSCTASDLVKDPCTTEWGVKALTPHPGIPYDLDFAPSEPIKATPSDQATDFLTIPFAPDQLGWLTGQGMMLMPVEDLAQFTIEVKTRQSSEAPFLEAVYCTPEWVPKN